MLIFDRFPSPEKAREFAAAVQKLHRLKAWICGSQEESNRIDPFPFRLDPPVVLVEHKDDSEQEGRIRNLVKQYGGTFAGT